MQYERFTQLAERIAENARLRFLETGGVPLTLFIVTPRDRLKLVELPGHIVRPVHEVIRDAVERHRGTSVVVVGEAWLAEYKALPEGEMAESLEAFLAHHPSPQAHPDRKDVLMVEAIHPEGSRTWLMRISRESGKAACGRPEPFEKGGTVFGRGLSDVLRLRNRDPRELE